jgi:hypothetical protein
MKTVSRIRLFMIAALCAVVLFSQTAHAADRAAHVTTQLTLSSQVPVKLSFTLPQQRRFASIANVVLPEGGLLALQFSLFGLGPIGLRMAAAETARQLAKSAHEQLSVAAQHPRFILRV